MEYHYYYPPSGRNETAVEDLERVLQLYASELRALISRRSLSGESWPEVAACLVERIVHSVDTARSVIGGSLDPAVTYTRLPAVPSAMMMRFSGGEGSSCTSMGGLEGESSRSSRERNFKISWTNQPFYDGHEWRKYGQKKISGSRFDRQYYRCAYKDHGCRATKQVQQHSDGDQPLYVVKCQFQHTCKSSSTPHSSSAPAGRLPRRGQRVLSFSLAAPSSRSGGKSTSLRPRKCAKLREETTWPAAAPDPVESAETPSVSSLPVLADSGCGWDDRMMGGAEPSIDDDIFSPEMLEDLDVIIDDDIFGDCY